MQLTAIVSTWNNALWIEHALRWMYSTFDTIVIQEANWTSDDTRWAGETSPDGTAERIRAFPDPDRKIQFYQLGRWKHGCLAARAELCSRVPVCDAVWVCDVDEFMRDRTVQDLRVALPALWQMGYTTVSQPVRSFYWDFHQHTSEAFTRIYRWYPGINCWAARYPRPRDLHVECLNARRFGQAALPDDRAGYEIFHYSYVPPPGVEIKGAQSFDVSLARYQSWYQSVFRRYTGDNLDAVYRENAGGVHVFGGMPVTPYRGPHPEVLDDHPLRSARWAGEGYQLPDGSALDLKGWWNRG